MDQDDVQDMIIRIIYINGYILLYCISTVFAGCIGLLGFWVSTQMLKITMGKRIIPWRNHIEFTRGLCVLICATMYLIVAVGLLFMHLLGGLPHEYDMVVVQIGIASFGIFMFTLMCVVIFAFLAVLLWLRHLGFNKDDILREADEETGLLGNKVYRIYGCKDPRHAGSRSHGSSEAVSVEDDEATDDESDKDDEEEQYSIEEADVPSPDPMRIRLDNLSSVRNLDVRRMRD